MAYEVFPWVWIGLRRQLDTLGGSSSLRPTRIPSPNLADPAMLNTTTWLLRSAWYLAQLAVVVLVGRDVSAAEVAGPISVAQVSEPAAGDAGESAVNVASSVKYRCDPAPNYWGWKGPQHGDQGQLTDGKIVELWHTASGPFYELPSSMGWTAMPPVVVFDLGEPRAISGIGIHSLLSIWGPWWPEKIAVLVSDNNRDFYLAVPELSVAHEQLDPPLDDATVQAAIDRVLVNQGLQATTHWFRQRGWKAHGRYVALIMAFPPDTGVIMVDEIQIYGGPLGEKLAARPRQVFSEGSGGQRSYQLYRAVNQRLSRDVAALRRKIERASLAAAERQRLSEKLAALDARRVDVPVRSTADFRAVFPLSELHAELFALHAELWRAQGAPRLHVWKTHRWDPLGPLAQPDGSAGPLDVTMAGNSVRSRVLNLSNAGEQAALIEIELEDLPATHIDVSEVSLVDTQAFEPVATALTPARQVDRTYRTTVAAGMTRQLWLRFSSGALPPGRYQGAVVLTGAAETNGSVRCPVSLEVLPLRLPDRGSLHVGGWDYARPGSYQVTEENLDAYLAVLKKYGVNTTWAGDPFGYGKYDKRGNLIEPPSRATAEQWLGNWPAARLYCAVFFKILPLDTPQRAARYEAWARDWSSYLQGRGIAADRVALLIRDEPTTEAELQIILETGRAIKQGEPRFKIWNDIHFPDPTRAPAILDDVMRQACDIQCFNTHHYLNLPETTGAFIQQQSRDGLQWWTYTGGGSHRLTDPYVAWLLRFWFCFDKGLTGAHFWAFGDGRGGFSWNEYFNGGPSYSPLYLDPTGVTVSKSMEALREGAQDYELLTLWETEAKRRGDPTAVTQLRDEVRRVLEVHTLDKWLWKRPKDRSVADTVRVKVLRALSERP